MEGGVEGDGAAADEGPDGEGQDAGRGTRVGFASPGRQAGLQRQARALGDPTRFAIFEHVVDSPGAVTVATLTARFALNHNAVRQHLAKLCEAGLLVEEFAARSGPGRPALQYRAGPGVPGTWSTQGPYEQLAALLLEVIVTGMSPREVGHGSGRLAASRGEDGSSVVRLVAEMGRRGFEPRHVFRPGREEVVLDYCPFAAAAKAQPDVVCAIHRGVAEGFLEGLGGDLQLSGLHLADPANGGCRIELRAGGTPPPEGA